MGFLYLHCPHCGCSHRHGSGATGLRGALCASPRPPGAEVGYTVDILPEAPPPALQLYAGRPVPLDWVDGALIVKKDDPDDATLPPPKMAVPMLPAKIEKRPSPLSDAMRRAWERRRQAQAAEREPQAETPPPPAFANTIAEAGSEP
jgi:hypothetical protein